MSKILTSFVLSTALGFGTQASAQQEQAEDISYSEPDEIVSCVFEAANFDGIVVRGAARDYMEADKLLEIEEVSGGSLPDVDIDMVKIKYSLCGSQGHEVEEYFDRVDVVSFLDDENMLTATAREAFVEANELFSMIPCDDPNIEWISSTLSDTSMTAYQNFCSPEQ